MGAVSEFFSRDHRRCDELFAAAEAAVHSGDWGESQRLGAAFTDALQRHLRMEEQGLFPAVSAISGAADGPIGVMRREHEQMRAVIRQLTAAIAGRNAETWLGLADTLMVLLQQHNMKEEGILYPMADRMLADRVEETLRRCRESAD